jgi:ABC-type dipeptide/oligopeptide/nickel transport system permease subunit
METVAAFHEGWARVVDIARHLVLPALTLSLFYMALYVRLMRAAMLEQAAMDYVTTARAKGLSETRITLSHVLRNAVLPVVTMAGVQVGSLLGGSIVVESVFAWPGLSLLAHPPRRDSGAIGLEHRLRDRRGELADRRAPGIGGSSWPCGGGSSCRHASVSA